MGPDGNILQQEGEDTPVSGFFYLAVVKAVLSFVLESWDIADSMSRTVERIHIKFLSNITRKKARRTIDGMWVTSAFVEVLKAYGMQTFATYIVHSKGRP